MDTISHKGITTQILDSLGDQATVSGLLAQLIDANIQDEGIIISQREQIASLRQDVEKFKQMNTELFLKIGATEPAAAPAAAAASADPDMPTIASLIDENGFFK